MAPIAEDYTFITNGIVLATSITGALYAPVLLALIGRFLYNVGDDLPPAYHTRHRSTKHTSQIKTFGILAVVSTFINVYNGIAWRVASYHRWAESKSLPLIGSWWNAHVARPSSIQFGQWYKEVDAGGEADAMMVGAPGALWWQAQNGVGLLVFAIFVGLECRHRNIPQYIAYSTILLAQSLGTATAVSVFFIVLTITHVPLKSTNNSNTTFLTAHPVVILLPALWSLIFLFYLPMLTTHGLWTYFSLAQYQIIPLLLCALAQPNYLHKIAKYTTNTSARKSYTAIFRVLSWASIAIHGTRTFSAIADILSSDSDVAKGLHHDYVWGTHSLSDLGIFGKLGMIVSKILGTLSQNPIVSYVAWDVILTQVAFMLWASSRGLDVSAMLASAGVWPSSDTARAIAGTVSEVASAVREKASDAIDSIEEGEEEHKQTEEEKYQELIDSAAHATGTTGHVTRLRTRAPSVSKAAPEPAPAVKKRPGRPRKGSTSATTSAVSSPARKATPKGRRSRAVTVETDAEEAPAADPTYEPTAAVQREVDAMTVLPEQDDDVKEEVEAAGLAWGLFFLGGLGSTAAGVLGAEVGGGK